MIADFVFDRVLPLLIGLLFAGLLLGLSLLGFDAVQQLRARHASFACAERNLQPIRKGLSTKVICRPRVHGGDTLNVRMR